MLQLLATPDVFVDKLVQIVEYYKFDGWLINIECDLPAEVIPRLVAFVSAGTCCFIYSMYVVASINIKLCVACRLMC